MKKILIFDTSICSTNIGDCIIMDGVKIQLSKIFLNDMFFYSITHDKIHKKTYELNKISNYSFIGGTNLLSSNMNRYNQWKINLIDLIFLKDIILMGVGWWQYQTKPNIYTTYLLKSILNRDILHSVRDSFTKQMLKNAGIHNVINTGCPTMWKLTEKHCQKIPRIKAENVIFTLTDYNKDIQNDKKFIDILIKNYNQIFFWAQGSEDYEYIKSFKGLKNIKIIGGNLRSLDNLLEDNNLSLDYIGTRLHAGVRSLQKFRRSIVLGIDNRAKEKSKDFNLKVLPRENISELENIIRSNFVTNIKLNEDNISKWKNQFR